MAPHEYAGLIRRWLAEPSLTDSWVVACALAAAAEPRALVTHLVTGLGIEVHVWVPGRARAVLRGRCCRDSPEETPFRSPQGFPPPVWYCVTMGQPGQDGEPRAPTVLSLGSLPDDGRLWLERLEVADVDDSLPLFLVASDKVRIDPPQHGLEQLKALAAQRSELQASNFIIYRGTSPDDYREVVGPQVAALRARWRALLAALVTKGLLDAKTAASAEARFEVHVQDERVDQSMPLPELR